ncbi:MAG: pyridoxamine 5'-phosphate oxidase [Acidimicrobiales bacterium]
MKPQWTPLSLSECDLDPFRQFVAWFDQAKDVMADREAIVLATASLDAHPSARYVLLRHVDEHSFGWYSNYLSRKGRELQENPYAALLWYCEALGRQIRIEGHVVSMSAEESDEYFARRPRGHQIGAHASHQSAPLHSREELERRVVEMETLFGDTTVPRPAHWGGFKMTPSLFEFWQHREDRLHDRIFYTLDAGHWTRTRHSP